MYQLSQNSVIVRMRDGACIPADPANADYAAYLAWLADDNQPAPAVNVTAPPRQLTALEYLDLFTEQEQIAVATAAMSSAPVKLMYDRMLAAIFITLADPRTEAGLNALVAVGLLTAPRKAAIVAAMR